MDRSKQLERFRQGKLSREEAEEFLRWYFSEEGEQFISSRLKESWEDDLPDDRQDDLLDKDRLFKKIQANKAESQVKVAFESKKKPSDNRIIYKIAASLIFTLAFSFLFYRYFDGLSKEEMVSDAIVWEVKSNPSGQKSRFKLPDGTKVYLNAESTIRYPKAFNANRTIELEGEAFFEVFEDKAHPFSVASKGLVTTALGTAFNIKAFKDSPKVEVVLAHGKVRVHEDNKQAELLPGEAIVRDGQKGEFKKAKVDIEKVLYWKEGILHFEDTEFQEVVRTLERWYNVDIHISGDYDQDFLCSGTFDKNEYLDNVLNILGYSIGFDYQINKQQVNLKFNPQK